MTKRERAARERLDRALSIALSHCPTRILMEINRDAIEVRLKALLRITREEARRD